MCLFCQYTQAFHPFADAEEALNNMNAVANGTVTDELKNFLELNLPKKKTKYTLGVCGEFCLHYVMVY